MGKTLRRTPMSRGKRDHGDNAVRRMKDETRHRVEDRRQTVKRERATLRQQIVSGEDFWNWA